LDNFNLKEKRKAIRISIVEPKHWLLDKSLELLEISTTGAFIKTEDKALLDSLALSMDIIHLFSINLPNELGQLHIPCDIARIQWTENKKKHIPKGYAVKFLELEGNMKLVFNTLLQYVRNQQIVVVAKRIQDEFFGIGKGPILK